MEARDPELRRELDATLQARGELGPEYESVLIDSFLEKVERRLAAPEDQRTRRLSAERRMAAARSASEPARPFGTFAERFGFGVVSLVLAVPLSAIGVANAGIDGSSWPGWGSSGSTPCTPPTHGRGHGTGGVPRPIGTAEAAGPAGRPPRSTGRACGRPVGRPDMSSRGDRRTPGCPEGGTTAVPARDAIPGQGRVSRPGDGGGPGAAP